MKTDDDIRTMLRSKAAEVRVSDDAWDKISARLEDAPARPIARRIALASAAAAAVAGTVFVANLEPAANVATQDPTTTTSVLAPAAGDPVAAATEWLQARVPQANLVPGRLTSDDGDGNVVVTFRGAIDTEVSVRHLSGRRGWSVVSAASDMIPLFDVTFDGNNLQGRATPTVDGEIAITYLADGVEDPGGTHAIAAGEDRGLDFHATEPVEIAGVRVTLTVDGTTYLSEVTAERVVDPAVATGSYVAIHPATDSAGLAEFQRQADEGFRPDLLDAQAVAGAFLAELLPRGETPTSYTVGEFQRGDTNSGEVPYTLSDGGSGIILLRTTGEEGGIWFVSGAVSDHVLEIVEIRTEETHRVADVRSLSTGTLTWTGATPIEVQAGQTVSISRPDTPLGAYPIVVRLMDGDRTLGIAAELG